MLAMVDIINDTIDFDRYPAGVQDFATIRNENMVYVDKTAYIYKLTRKSRSFFLSRPRRFGKSLLLSTIQAYFEGKKELFEGLAIYDYEKEWRRHPVIRIDLSTGLFNNIADAKNALNSALTLCARKLDIELTLPDITGQFQELIMKAYLKQGEKVVVLIDEYDKPLLETMHREEEMYSDIQSLIRNFYGCLKGSGEYLKFVLITGITKFSHVNIFSGLNNLIDLSLESWCNGICGISAGEMVQYFHEDMVKFGLQNNITTEEAAAKFKIYYDGYRFSGDGENIYNPYSVICAFSSMKFGEYWFRSGSSQNLIKILSSGNFDLTDLEGKIASTSELMAPPSNSGNPIGLLYQAGYLTIKEYIGDDTYIVGFPNKEVMSAFYNELLSTMFPDQSGNGFSASKVRIAANKGEPDELVNQLMLALKDYVRDQTKDINTEAVFNSLLYGLCKAIGLTTKAEYHTSNGRIDMVIETNRFIYLMEFKINSTAEVAMQQINSKGYANKYFGDSRTLFKIGLNFDTAKQQISDFLISPN